MKSIKFDKIKEKTIRFIWFLGEKAFLTFLLLFLLDLIFGGIVFYKYCFLVKKEQVNSIAEPLVLKEKTLQKVIKIWEEKEKKFKEAESKSYPDPFYIVVPEKKKLSSERVKELLQNSFIQDLLKASNLYEFYKAKGKELLLIKERAKIWEELGLGKSEEYKGTYDQNIKFLTQLKKELTK